MRFPGAIPAGGVAEELVLNLDLAPTLLDYAGVAVPAAMQGRSLRAPASGRAPEDWRTSFYYRYYEFPHGWHDVRPHYGIRTERYKLIRFTGDIDRWELYDLEADPHELHDLYGREGFAALRERLHRQLESLRREVGDDDGAGE